MLCHNLHQKIENLTHLLCVPILYETKTNELLNKNSVIESTNWLNIEKSVNSGWFEDWFFMYNTNPTLFLHPTLSIRMQMSKHHNENGRTMQKTYVLNFKLFSPCNKYCDNYYHRRKNWTCHDSFPIRLVYAFFPTEATFGFWLRGFPSYPFNRSIFIKVTKYLKNINKSNYIMKMNTKYPIKHHNAPSI